MSAGDFRDITETSSSECPKKRGVEYFRVGSEDSKSKDLAGEMTTNTLLYVQNVKRHENPKMGEVRQEPNK